VLCAGVSTTLTAAAPGPGFPVVLLAVLQALLLQMVGGVGREFPGTGMKLRGDIHICLMGDPVRFTAGRGQGLGGLGSVSAAGCCMSPMQLLY